MPDPIRTGSSWGVAIFAFYKSLHGKAWVMNIWWTVCPFLMVSSNSVQKVIGIALLTFHCNRMSERSKKSFWLSFVMEKTSQKTQLLSMAVGGCHEFYILVDWRGERGRGRKMKGRKKGIGEGGRAGESKSWGMTGGRPPEMVLGCTTLLLFVLDMPQIVMQLLWFRALLEEVCYQQGALESL